MQRWWATDVLDLSGEQRFSSKRLCVSRKQRVTVCVHLCRTHDCFHPGSFICRASQRQTGTVKKVMIRVRHASSNSLEGWRLLWRRREWRMSEVAWQHERYSNSGMPTSKRGAMTMLCAYGSMSHSVLTIVIHRLQPPTLALAKCTWNKLNTMMPSSCVIEQWRSSLRYIHRDLHFWLLPTTALVQCITTRKGTQRHWQCIFHQSRSILNCMVQIIQNWHAHTQTLALYTTSNASTPKLSECMTKLSLSTNGYTEHIIPMLQRPIWSMLKQLQLIFFWRLFLQHWHGSEKTRRSASRTWDSSQGIVYFQELSWQKAPFGCKCPLRDCNRPLPATEHRRGTCFIEGSSQGWIAFIDSSSRGCWSWFDSRGIKVQDTCKHQLKCECNKKLNSHLTSFHEQFSVLCQVCVSFMHM